MTDKGSIKVEDIRREADKRYSCVVQKSLYYITEFLSGPMCGRCFPCSMGCFEAKLRIAHIQQGEGLDADIKALRDISDMMLKASMCKKGKDSATFLAEWLNTGVFEEHTSLCCSALQCRTLVDYRIISPKCVSCGRCKAACRFNAIVGEEGKPYITGYLPFNILNRKCNRCGECIKVCPEDAIVLVCNKGE